MKTKDIVKIYRKKLTDGRESLYLAYDGNGKRETETLKLYLNPGTDAVTKSINKATLVKARLEQADRIKAILEGRSSGLARKVDPAELTIAEYFLQRQEEYEDDKSMKVVYGRMAKRLDCYGRVDKPMRKLTVEDMRKLMRWMMDKYAENTAHNMYTLINSAMQVSCGRDNPLESLSRTEKPHKPDSTRTYLSLDDVRKLAATDCKYPFLKQSFLFACFTGLRVSDVKRLTWSMIKDGKITIKMKKAGRYVTVPISDNAKGWMPERKYDDGLIWPELARMNITTRTINLDKWAKTAGLKEKVSFHISRHTCATLLLEYGADLYTVSKILGHANISTTQIYAKVVDHKKDEAVKNIPKI